MTIIIIINDLFYSFVTFQYINIYLYMTDTVVQFEALFDHATIGIVVTNKDGQIINFNKYAESQFGYSREEVLGQKVEILIPSRFHHAHEHHREGFYEHPSHRRMGEGRDLNALKKDNSIFPVEISISSYHDKGELFVIAFIIDITVRKKNEEVVLNQKAELEDITRQVKQLNAELERKVDDRTRMLKETLAELEHSKEELSEALETEKQLSDLKSRFVTMASHEFRTPLSTILSSSYLAEQYTAAGEAEKTAKHLKRIKAAVAGLKSILEDFLSLGKLEEGVVKANIETISAKNCLADIREALLEMEQISKQGQEILLTHSGQNQITVDRQILKNILLNMLSNAIKFSGENMPISIDASFEIGGLRLTIKDKGIGISDDDQQFLTGRFFRAKNAINIQGTGLGLHIVLKYLELLNGKLTLKSKLNEGSEFTIFLPNQLNKS